MATIDDAETIRKMIADDGAYGDDPRPHRIYKYRNPQLPDRVFFMVAYALEDIAAMMESPSVSAYFLLWDANRGLTPEGEVFMRGGPRAAS